MTKTELRNQIDKLKHEKMKKMKEKYDKLAEDAKNKYLNDHHDIDVDLKRYTVIVAEIEKLHNNFTHEELVKNYQTPHFQYSENSLWKFDEYTNNKVYKDLRTKYNQELYEVNTEFNKLEQFIVSMTANKAFELFKSMGLPVKEITTASLVAVDAPKINKDLIL